MWLGRRQIPGIDLGRTLKVWGRISCHEGRRLIYNPRYELMEAPAARDRARPRCLAHERAASRTEDGVRRTHDQQRADAETPQFRYVEEFVRYQLGKSLGGARGMIESALPFIAFTIAWVIGRQLYPAIGAAVGTALVLATIRLVQRQSIKYVVQAVIPTAIAVLIATRTGRAQDVFLARHPLQRRPRRDLTS